jgi:hypothetical protein
MGDDQPGPTENIRVGPGEDLDELCAAATACSKSFIA